MSMRAAMVRRMIGGKDIPGPFECHNTALFGPETCARRKERLSFLMARHIEIFDTTLRDGNKLPFAVLSPSDRLLLARQLAGGALT